MRGYYYKKNLNRRVKRWERAHRVFLVGFIVVLLAVVAVGVYVWQQSSIKETAVENQKKVTETYYGNPKHQYDSGKFYFESSYEWQFSRPASQLPNKYVYYSSHNGLIQYELDIYMDKTIGNLPVKYIIPVTIPHGKIVSQEVSPRCKFKGDGKPTQAVYPQQYAGVKFFCDVIGSEEFVAAGVVGGSYDLPLYDSKGSLSYVGISLKDQSDRNYTDVLKQIVDSFKLD